MRSAKIEFVPEARREIDDAFEWYLERNLQTAEEFLQELDTAVELIVRSPAVWPRFEADTRKYILPKFPYDIFYREIHAGIEVIAVAHHRRRPKYWRRRLRRS